jgi:hypothetical protein
MAVGRQARAQHALGLSAGFAQYRLFVPPRIGEAGFRFRHARRKRPALLV